MDFQFKLAHKCFQRVIGTFAMGTISDVHVSPEGKVISDADWTHHSSDWLPSSDDHAHVQSLMQRVTEPGKMASWIAPPARGIDNKPLEFEYVQVQ